MRLSMVPILTNSSAGGSMFICVQQMDGGRPVDAAEFSGSGSCACNANGTEPQSGQAAALNERMRIF